jgi:protein-S-isoprenylcysteine O-methyltransferase
MDVLLRFGREARRVDAAPADRGTTRALYFALATVVLATFALAPFLSFTRLRAPLAWVVAWSGAVLIPAGYALRAWATLTLGRSYTRTLRIQEGQRLERRGPYRWVRHPGYLGSLTMWSAVALTSANLAAIALSLAALGVAYGLRIRGEEAMMRAAFGAEYAEYSRSRGALLPKSLRGDPPQP